jgi:hypothetical protein
VQVFVVAFHSSWPAYDGLLPWYGWTFGAKLTRRLHDGWPSTGNAVPWVRKWHSAHRALP